MLIPKGLVYFGKRIGGQSIQRVTVLIQFPLYMGIWNCVAEMDYI